jgi:hypothetical protein
MPNSTTLYIDGALVENYYDRCNKKYNSREATIGNVMICDIFKHNGYGKTGEKKSVVRKS